MKRAWAPSYNDFCYLCGVEVPHAYLLLDGTNQTSTLFLAHQSKGQKEGEGEILNPDAIAFYEQLGMQRVRQHDEYERAIGGHHYPTPANY